MLIDEPHYSLDNDKTGLSWYDHLLERRECKYCTLQGYQAIRLSATKLLVELFTRNLFIANLGALFALLSFRLCGRVYRIPT